MYKIARRQQGVTLIELMISSTIGLLLTAAVGALFIQNKQSYSQNEHISFIQDNAKYALSTLTNDLSATDFWGGVTTLSNITNTAPAFAANTECGATGSSYDVTTSLVYLRQPSASLVTTTFPCLSSIDTGTDVLLIKRVHGQSTTTLTDNRIYLRATSMQNGILFQQTSTQPARAANQADWEYIIHLYYIKNDKLMRKTLGATNTPSMTEETLAEGIENFRVEFGIDSDSPAEGTANFFLSNPTTTQLNNAVEARVHLLARANSTLSGYVNDKSYVLGDLTIASANDGYLRRTYTASTPLRNVDTLRR